MGEKRDTSHTPGNGWACRCVVLVDAGAVRPDSLLAGLRKRGASVRLVSDAAVAMVEIHCLQAQAIIICQPEQTRSLDSLRAALHASYPDVVCWRYDASEPSSSISGNGDPTGRLAPFSFIPKPDSKSVPPRFEPAPAEPPSPAAGRRAAPLDAAPEPAAESSLPGQRLVAPISDHDELARPAELSADELAMLLGPEFAQDLPDENNP